MTSLETIIQQVEELSTAEQLRLLAHLAEHLRQPRQTDESPHTWERLRGLANYPFLGEDAQAWVSRSRQENERVSDQPR
jgi:hypothetical protein